MKTSQVLALSLLCAGALAAVEPAPAAAQSACPSASLAGGGAWTNRGYGGSWDVALTCSGSGAVKGRVSVGGSNHCSGFPVEGAIAGGTVTFESSDSRCGSWDVAIPLDKGELEFAPKSGEYPGVRIIRWHWK